MPVESRHSSAAAFTTVALLRTPPAAALPDLWVLIGRKATKYSSTSPLQFLYPFLVLFGRAIRRWGYFLMDSVHKPSAPLWFARTLTIRLASVIACTAPRGR